MKQQHNICNQIKCSSLNKEENKCSFNDCIFTTSELKIKAETIENKEFYFFLIKFAGTLALAFLLSLVLLKAGGQI